MNYIVLAIPVFFILIGVEVLISRLQQTQLYRFNDAVTNISCGLTQQVANIFFKTALILGYTFLYKNYRLLEIEDNFYTWTLLFIGVDFFYYWFHRYAHEVSVFWGTHIVHHQSEEYNFSVALRQSTFQAFVSSLFYLPLAIIGFNPVAFVTINAFQTLYQFWIHTKTIDKLPAFFEYLFNTPSHHRVHHGRNPKYIDKNHGGTLIIFDRMFGTFQAEEEEVVYGVTKPLATWNPIWANVDYYNDLWGNLRQPMNWSDRWKMLIKKPGWLPEHLGGYQAPPPITPVASAKFDTIIPLGLNYYVLAQYLLLLIGSSLYLFNLDNLDLSQQYLGAFLIVWTVFNLGGILESKTWAFRLEGLRLLLIPFIFYLLMGTSTFFIYSILILSSIVVASLFWLFPYRV